MRSPPPSGCPRSAVRGLDRQPGSPPRRLRCPVRGREDSWSSGTGARWRRRWLRRGSHLCRHAAVLPQGDVQVSDATKSPRQAWGPPRRRRNRCHRRCGRRQRRPGGPVGADQGRRSARTQNSFPSGSASTTQLTSSWPTSACRAPRSSRRWTSSPCSLSVGLTYRSVSQQRVCVLVAALNEWL
jgi:hypothetical protein